MRGHQAREASGTAARDGFLAAVAGGVALVAAIGVHGFVGSTDLWHLTPALAAAAALA